MIPFQNSYPLGSTEVVEFFYDSHYYDVFLTKMNPTGKWRIRQTSDGKRVMDIQHKGLLIKKWISEDSICYQYNERILFENKCNR